MSGGFPQGIDKRRALLDWMRNGDTSSVPVMVGPGLHLAASYFGEPLERTTWEMAARAAVETGTENMQCIGSPLPFNAIPFTDDLSLVTREQAGSDGIPVRESVLSTPRGKLTEKWQMDPKHGSVHREFYVKGPEDMPAFESFIRIAVATILENPAVREQVLDTLREEKERGAGFFPTCLWVFCPAVELTSSYYMDQQTAIYALYDEQELLEELFELHWKTTEIWLECGREADVDLYGYAINGLEWLSPDLYERYMIPQARRINDNVRSIGKLSWLHTCGRKRGLIERDAYSRIKMDLLESLSGPPTGDIHDYRWARRAIGPEVTTRGGVNCELFYTGNPEAVAHHAHRVLDGCRGYRHMVGDTNPSVPAYPWATINALIDVVHERGGAFASRMH